jgi:hypothetical protein
MRLTTAAIAIASVTGAAHAGVIYVNHAAAGANTGASWTDAFTDLQSALAAAAPGDEVWVARGTYTPGEPGNLEATYRLESGVSLLGGFAGNETAANQRNWAANETILSGDLGRDDVYGSPVWYIGWNIHTPNCLHVVTGSGADATAVLDGFTITAGRATQTSGGGMFINAGSPTVRNCTFFRDLAAFNSGGGIACLDASPIITDCRFVQNWVHLGSGAGVLTWGTSQPTIEDCEFIQNRSVGDVPEAAGGAIDHRASTPLPVTRCQFTGNLAISFAASGGHAGGYGGAVHNLGGPLAVRDCTFTDNLSNAGGAIWTWRDATIVNCLFVGNDAPEYQASQGGWGGIAGAIGASAFQPATVRVANCTIYGNTAKAGAGIRMVNSATGDVANCVLWANTDEWGAIGPAQIRGSKADNSCIQNMLVGIPGEDPPDPKDFPGCISDNPLLVSPGTDFRLSAGSPCIDAGKNDEVPAGVTTDMDGRARFVDDPATPDTGIGTPPLVDIGAYEFQAETCYPDCNTSGTLTIADFGCFQTRFVAADPYTDCNASGGLTVADFACFQARFVAGCR